MLLWSILYALSMAYDLVLAIRVFYIFPKSSFPLDNANSIELISFLLYIVLVLGWVLFTFTIGYSLLSTGVGASWSALIGAFYLFPACFVIHLIYEIIFLWLSRAEKENAA